MPDGPSLSDRVLQLEELLSHHEHRLQQLNEVVVDLLADHDSAKAKFQVRLDRLVSLVQTASEPLDPDEKPPHY